jgi:hypothetical protein
VKIRPKTRAMEKASKLHEMTFLTASTVGFFSITMVEIQFVGFELKWKCLRLAASAFGFLVDRTKKNENKSLWRKTEKVKIFAFRKVHASRVSASLPDQKLQNFSTSKQDCCTRVMA